MPREPLTYHRGEDGQMYPDVYLEGYREIGRYGQMALDLLKERDSMKVTGMFMDGTLWARMSEIDEAAREMLIDTEERLRRSDPPPKTDDFLKVLGHNNAIRSMAEEIVIHEFISQVS